jgi:hypothetical protein
MLNKSISASINNLLNLKWYLLTSVMWLGNGTILNYSCMIPSVKWI